MSFPDSTVARFWAKVEKTETCWLWVGAKNRHGYGNFGVVVAPGEYKTMLPHRFAYELLVGPIPDDLTIDHLCRNRACVNPAHLEAVTLRENVLRGEGFAGLNARKTHCPQGHPLSGSNLYMTPGNRRHCRACKRQTDLSRDRRRRGVAA